MDGDEGGGKGEGRKGGRKEGTDQMLAVISVPAGMWYPSYTSSVITRWGNPTDPSLRYHQQNSRGDGIPRGTIGRHVTHIS